MTNPSAPDGRSPAELLNDLRNGSLQEQEQALIRLGAVGDAESLDAVVDLMGSMSGELRNTALDTLRILANKYMPLDRYGMAEALIPYLGAEDWAQRLVATRLLSTHPSELATNDLRRVVEESIEKLSGEQGGRYSPARMVAERVLVESIMALANCGRLSALPDILEYLDDANLRPIAVRALGLVGSETERNRLEDLVEDTDTRVRDGAQWALGLMDERIEQLTNPPDHIPEPPPDRLHPVYWAHRTLEVGGDELMQFLIVRMAVEHLMLDPFLSEGRVPEECLITIRRFVGNNPPEWRANRAEIIGVWQYQFQGPELTKMDKPTPAGPPQLQRPGMPGSRGAGITISYPANIEEKGEGLVSFDCLFGPFFGRGWMYHVARRDGEWTFSLVRRTWTS
jgi:hypothetical protein